MNYYNPYYGNQYMSQFGNQYPQFQQQKQYAVQPQQEQTFQGIKFLTADEIKAYIVLPNTSEILVDKSNAIAHIKSADAMGQSSTRMFKFEEISELPQSKAEVPTIDTSSFITREEIKDFLRREDLKTIDDKLTMLEKQIKIEKILKGEDDNGQ